VSQIVLEGLDGSNPLGFMAAVGLLRLLHLQSVDARLGFIDAGVFTAWVESKLGLEEISKVVAEDATAAAGPQPWRLEYTKEEKRGLKTVADLKAPPQEFSKFLDLAIDEWLVGRPQRAEYAACYGTDVARDGKGNTKPTAFHFTAANQKFLDTVEDIRKSVTEAWVRASLQESGGEIRKGGNLRWSTDSDRNRALMGVNPEKEDTTVNGPLEWLAFRGLPVFTTVPVQGRVATCGFTGRRQDELCFNWPLWNLGSDYHTLRSLLASVAGWIDMETRMRHAAAKNPTHQTRLIQKRETIARTRRARGIFALCSSQIRRSAQGFGNFGPAQIID